MVLEQRSVPIWISCYAHFASFMHLRFKSMVATWAAVGAPNLAFKLRR